MPTYRQSDAHSPLPLCQKAAVTIAEMARLCGLSRTRFYQLLRDGTLPAPRRNAETNRPFYDAAGQAACLKVKATNCGVNGAAVLFYARRVEAAGTRPSRAAGWNVPKPRGSPRTRTDPQGQSLLDSLRQLGLEGVNVETALTARSSCFPDGLSGVDDATILTAVFRHLTRQNSGGNVER